MAAASAAAVLVVTAREIGRRHRIAVRPSLNGTLFGAMWVGQPAAAGRSMA
ncbi:hypothetical protein [Streptomyces sp. 8L]|uniref:hypothetical protein n=1 Tax=Streptomyces sp. 8L TaxID=2877242 RepID=UPI001CD6DDA7|nr:hypothetical protein [Streptomyces sp. 8L]MCA1222926.1 hypothetical protein [Streptomyces sp. 8L]